MRAISGLETGALHQVDEAVDLLLVALVGLLHHLLGVLSPTGQLLLERSVRDDLRDEASQLAQLVGHVCNVLVDVGG